MVSCPICGRSVKESFINQHLDSDCSSGLEAENGPPPSTAPFFKTPASKSFLSAFQSVSATQPTPSLPKKRLFSVSNDDGHDTGEAGTNGSTPAPKKSKPNAFERAAPLAERMRPKTLNDICGQDLVGPNGVLRGLIERDRVPSMILWGHAGTGKTTIARLIATQVDARFVEINSTSSGVGECKKIFAEARAELGLTGRKTIIFCDEIHRFSKSQQDVFLGPVEAGHVTLIGATTENPSFKVQNALLSRCRTFTLDKLTDEDITVILNRALDRSNETYKPNAGLVNQELLVYLASFADGDARTALNLLELAMDLSTRPEMTVDNLKSSLTKTLVYDRAGDQHYDTISALHKSIRGSDADAALYYLARMVQSGEEPLYIARRMVVIASEDIGLADNNMLSLATATYSACEKIGLPECGINLAHCAIALALAPKSTRAYRSLSNAMSALNEPGIAGLPIPLHLRNAPTRFMKELGYGKEYKYNPHYVNGRVKQEYLPDRLGGRTFLDDRDLGTKVDPDLGNEAVKATEVTTATTERLLGHGVDRHDTIVAVDISAEEVAENDKIDMSNNKVTMLTATNQQDKLTPVVNGCNSGMLLDSELPHSFKEPSDDEATDDLLEALPLSSQTKPPEEWE